MDLNSQSGEHVFGLLHVLGVLVVAGYIVYMLKKDQFIFHGKIHSEKDKFSEKEKHPKCSKCTNTAYVFARITCALPPLIEFLPFNR